jgi:hypothetical protein
VQFKPCPLCGEEINAKHKYCQYCGGYVDYTGEDKDEELMLEEENGYHEEEDNIQPRLQALEEKGIRILINDEKIMQEANRYRLLFGRSEYISYLNHMAEKLGLENFEWTEETLDDIDLMWETEDLEEDLRIIPFGRIGKSKEPLLWQVLAEDDNIALLITKDCIAQKAYHDVGRDITHWQYSSLRKWLNLEFIADTFDIEEEKTIHINRQYSCEGEANTSKDKVFLLSVEEAERFFVNDKTRIANYQNEPVWWWLRTICEHRYAQGVCEDGSIDRGARFMFISSNVLDHVMGVRPAIWLNISALHKNS